MAEPLPPCGDDEPERNAGGPIDDGWEVPVAPRWNPDDDLVHDPGPFDPHAFDDVVPTRLAAPPREVDDGVDSGAEPGQPA